MASCTDLPLKIRERVLARLEKYTEPEPNTGCWLWTDLLSDEGYGKVWVKGGRRVAHRVSYELHVGPIPAGHQLDHRCKVRCCVNPAHLEPVTPRENSARSAGPSGVNARKTHCHVGHELAGPNLYVKPNGNRQCRACRDLAQRRWYVERTGVAA